MSLTLPFSISNAVVTAILAAVSLCLVSLAVAPAASAIQCVDVDCTQTGSNDGTSTSGSTSKSDGNPGVPGVTDPAAKGNKCTVNGGNCSIIDNYVNPAIRFLSVIVGVAATIGVIVGGIEISSSAGDPQKSASGKRHIRNAVIAIVAYVFLFAFIKFLTPGL